MQLKSQQTSPPMPPPGEQGESSASSFILAHSLHYLKTENMTSYTKLEVHNTLHSRQKRTEPRPPVACTENLVKFGNGF